MMNSFPSFRPPGLLLSVLLLVSCGETVPPAQERRNDDKSPKTVSADTTEPENSLYASVDTPDLGGYGFPICNNLSNFACQVIDLDETAGNPLNDARYRRNAEMFSFQKAAPMQESIWGSLALFRMFFIP